ncbi:MAG: hypothetical protein PUJ93_07655, partial [Oscillospiraceae bacterium]|nr:hypothetical protein [Oscillospiraceae bacterium]MDY5735584.1 hypothetical protein [Oscillospiraceae bacterium]
IRSTAPKIRTVQPSESKIFEDCLSAAFSPIEYSFQAAFAFLRKASFSAIFIRFLLLNIRFLWTAAETRRRFSLLTGFFAPLSRAEFVYFVHFSFCNLLLLISTCTKDFFAL